MGSRQVRRAFMPLSYRAAHKKARCQVASTTGRGEACGRAKQFFRAARRKKLIAEDPFADMAAVSVRANKSREFFVTREMADRVLAACPDAEWRLIFALSRYGGLRTPSEHVCLKWGHINWERNRMTVTSPKTEQHEGKAERMIPIFPELRSLLEAVYDIAPEGSEFVIRRYRDSRQNLRTTFEKIIRRAGLDPWPKLFQNLRASRETELADEYPIHVVCAWIGNSQAVAKKHYLQVTDEHMQKAVGPTGGGAKVVQSGPEMASKDEHQNSGAVENAWKCAMLPVAAGREAPRAEPSYEPCARERFS